MNKQHRGDYGNAQNTVPAAQNIPNQPMQHRGPTPTPSIPVLHHPHRTTKKPKL